MLSVLAPLKLRSHGVITMYGRDAYAKVTYLYGGKYTAFRPAHNFTYNMPCGFAENDFYQFPTIFSSPKAFSLFNDFYP
jgi:hypothetical protein